MADELAIHAGLRFEKGDTVISLDAGLLEVTVTGGDILQQRQTIGTVEEALVLGDVTAGGYCLMINRDATNYVEVRPASGVADLIRMKAGEFCLFRVTADATPYLIANTGAVVVEYVILDD